MRGRKWPLPVGVGDEIDGFPFHLCSLLEGNLQPPISNILLQRSSRCACSSSRKYDQPLKNGANRIGPSTVQSSLLLRVYLGESIVCLVLISGLDQFRSATDPIAFSPKKSKSNITYQFCDLQRPSSNQGNGNAIEIKKLTLSVSASSARRDIVPSSEFGARLGQLTASCTFATVISASQVEESIKKASKKASKKIVRSNIHELKINELGHSGKDIESSAHHFGRYQRDPCSEFSTKKFAPAQLCLSL